MITQPYTLTQLQNLAPTNGYYQQQVSFTDIRDKAIQQAAQALGMQAGLAAESQSIDAQLEQNAQQLDSIFNFSLVIYKNNLLPPVIVRADNLVNIDDQGDSIRIAGITYNIVESVRFVTTPPTWRTYLWMAYPQPQLPNKILLPVNAAEKAIWQANVTEGWQEGVNQAVGIYQINLHTMVRDFNGMLLYKQLLVQNMISPFYVQKSQQGVTGSGNHMMVDDRTWQITAQPQLQLQSKFWAPVGVSNNGPNSGSSS
ncbi:MAG: type IV secretory system conjugative DNA transfer family protein [Gammaproteobacteria bacterium]|nr:type IV secretory system conjugative DNA transfer family protein [Gammaproteobacteria bacterium]